ncbi:hypothetical protein D3C73_1414830 [compost metagenome]
MDPLHVPEAGLQGKSGADVGIGPLHVLSRDLRGLLDAQLFAGISESLLQFGG